MSCKNIFSSKSILYIYRLTNRQFTEHCCHNWSRDSAMHLVILDKIHRGMCKININDLVCRLQSHSNHPDIALLYRFYKYSHSKFSDEIHLWYLAVTNLSAEIDWKIGLTILQCLGLTIISMLSFILLEIFLCGSLFRPLPSQ